MSEPVVSIPEQPPRDTGADGEFEGGPGHGAGTTPPRPLPAHTPSRRGGTGGTGGGTTAWRSRDVLRVALILAAVFIVLRLIWFASELVLLGFLGILFGIAISAGADYLQRFRVPRGAGAPAVVLVFLGLLYGLGASSAPTIALQAGELKAKLPEAIQRVDSWLIRGRGGELFRALSGQTLSRSPAKGAANEVPETRPGSPAAVAADTLTETSPTTTLASQVSHQLQSVTHYLFSFLTSTVTVVASLIIVIFVGIYLAVDPNSYKRGILLMVPREGRPVADRVMRDTVTVLRKWLLTQLIAMVVIGVVTTIALLLLGVKAPFALGAIAGLLEFVPTIGPIMSAIPGITMGFLDSPQKALYVGIAYLTIQQLEGHILIPLLMKGEMDLPPVLTIFAQALMALLFGFIGLMVAVPLLAAIIVPIKLLYVDDDSKQTPDDAQLSVFG